MSRLIFNQLIIYSINVTWTHLFFKIYWFITSLCLKMFKNILNWLIQGDILPHGGSIVLVSVNNYCHQTYSWWLVSYHVTSFKDPVEGKVLVGFVESSSNTRGSGVIQGGPPQLVESRQTLPLQSLHPQLLTCDRGRCSALDGGLHPAERKLTGRVSYPWCPRWDPADRCRPWHWLQQTAAGRLCPPLVSWSLLPCCWRLAPPGLNTQTWGEINGLFQKRLSKWAVTVEYLPRWHSGGWCPVSSWLVRSSAGSVIVCGGVEYADVPAELMKKKKNI